MSETTNNMAVWAIGHIVFNLPTQWRSRKEGKWGHAPLDAVLTLFPSLNSAI